VRLVWRRVRQFAAILFRQALFVARASVQPLTASGRTTPGKMETAGLTVAALASVPVDLPQADLERVPAPTYSGVPTKLRRPARALGEGSDELPVTS